MTGELKTLSGQFLKHRDSLFAFICMFTHRTDVAEDIFQEVWLKLADAAEKQTRIEDVAAWSRKVAKNLILHHWRAQKSNPIAADAEVLDLMDKAFERDALSSVRAERSAALKRCVDALPDRSKNFLRLKFDEGLSTAAMAERLKESCEAVRKQLWRLRQSLEECARRRLATEDVRL